MLLEVSQETERMVRQEIASGRFRSADEILQRGMGARNEGDEAHRMERHRRAVEWMLDFAKRRAAPLDGITIKELIEEGRRM
jgi:Arc/MetJ-type ribon-helix-helix transcriptional regulator